MKKSSVATPQAARSHSRRLGPEVAPGILVADEPVYGNRRSLKAAVLTDFCFLLPAGFLKGVSSGAHSRGLAFLRLFYAGNTRKDEGKRSFFRREGEDMVYEGSLGR